MTGNPELRRNLWIELTPHRLVAMPLVLAALLALAVVANDGAWGKRIAGLAGFAFGAIVLLWGTRLAAGSILDEAAGRTWDGQRLSSLGAWEMTWGKLLGSTAYPWYGGGFCLAVLVVAGLADWTPRRVGIVAGCLLAAALLCHAGAIFIALLALRHDPGAPARRSQGAGLLPFAAAAWALGHLFEAFAPGRDPVVWFGLPVPPAEFLLASLLLFAAWAVAGAWSLMRAELQMGDGPEAWVGFVLFTMAYFAGLAPAAVRPGTEPAPWAASPWLCAALVVALAAVYLAALADPKNPVEYRRVLGLRRAGLRRAAVAAAPRWMHALLLAAAAGAALGVAPFLERYPEPQPWRAAAFAVGALGFAVRDVGLILGLNLGGKQKRADAAALLYLLLLYAVLPQLLRKLSGAWALDLFYPMGNGALSVIAPAAQAAAAVALVAARWRRRWALPPA